MSINSLNLDTIRNYVREAAKKAFSELRQAYPNDEFYYYVLWTTVVAHRPAPCACSKQGLERTFAQYLSDSSDETTPADLRWSEADSLYDCFVDEHFTDVAELFNDLGDPYERSDELNHSIFESIVLAMSDLDNEGFFGEGTEREKVVINVTMPGDESEDELVERARRLNPKSALAQLEKDMV